MYIYCIPCVYCVPKIAEGEGHSSNTVEQSNLTTGKLSAELIQMELPEIINLKYFLNINC